MTNNILEEYYGGSIFQLIVNNLEYRINCCLYAYILHNRVLREILSDTFNNQEEYLPSYNNVKNIENSRRFKRITTKNLMQIPMKKDITADLTTTKKLVSKEFQWYWDAGQSHHN